MKHRRLIGIVLLLALLSVSGFAWYRWTDAPAYSIASRGGISMVMTNFPAQPYYLQTDPDWKDETVGGSGELLSAAGCTVCCVSMAFSQLGLAMDPKTLNADLKQRGGYTGRGWLKWDAAAAASKGAMAFELPRKPRHAAIDSALRSGNPVIAKILLWESIPHWVLIVGKDGEEYLVKNPLCRERAIQRVSQLSDRIQSVRIVKAAAAQGPGSR